MVGRLLATDRADATTNGVSGSGSHLPPPSTIAAQLVRNHAGVARAEQNVDGNATATFGQLLQEILNNLTTPETDAEVNYKLIRVVTEAGLDVLTRDNPFAQWDILVPQAVDSIAVIQSTIKRQPELVFFGSSDQSTGQNSPHLLLWLLPKLLRIATHPKCTQLCNPIATLLKTVVESLLATLDWWRYAHSILDAYRDCVDDVLAALEGCSASTKRSFRDYEVTLPPARTIVKLNPGSRQAVALPLGSQIHILNLTEAMSVVTLVLTTFVQLSKEAVAPNRSLDEDSSSLQWLMNTLSTLNRLVLAHRRTFGSDRILLNSATQLLSLLRSVCFPVPSFISRTGINTHPVVLLCQCLSDYLRSCTKDMLPVEIQSVMTTILQDLMTLRDRNLHRKIIEEFLTPAIQLIRDNLQSSSGCSKDLGHVLATWLQTAGHASGDTVSKDSNGDTDMTGVQSDHTNGAKSTLAHVFKTIMRPTFRKTSKHIAGSAKGKDLYLALIGRITEILVRRRMTDLRDVSKVTSDTYMKMTDVEETELWSLLAIYSCVATDHFKAGRCKACHENARLCNSSAARIWVNSSSIPNDSQNFSVIIKELLQNSRFQDSPEQRLHASLAVRSFLIHTPVSKDIELGKSSLGEWCLRALTSSTRELRIGAGRTLVTFLVDDLPAEIRDNNRRLALEYLRTLSDRAALAHHETLILAWGHIAVVCGERELNLALLRLVEYLGHPNSLICALASAELERIADCLSLSPAALFKPFWRTIAVSVVQDLLCRPQKIQLLSDFLQIGVDRFLLLTQQDTLPSLILTKKRDILQRLALARGPRTKVEDICLQPRTNLAAILALLLLQPSPDIEATATAILADTVPALRDHDLVSLIKLDPMLIAAEMLKVAGDEDPSRKSRTYQSIQNFAILTERKAGQAKTSVKANKMLASFFETYVLGIMTSFSETIEKTDDAQAVSEKTRCIRAIEEMIQLAKTHISVAVPQIRACLQSAIDQKGLLEPAFSTWLVMMRNLEGEDVVHLLDHLFAVTVQHWSALPSELQQRTYDTIAYMLKTHSNLIRDEVITIPSLAEIPLMSKFEAEIKRLQEHETSDSLLNAFAGRLKDENASIVLQALRELTAWLEKNQTFLHEAAISEPPLPVVSIIVRTVLDASIKYSATHPVIGELCANALGIIGCLDSNRIEANISKRQILVLSNFVKVSEVIDWVAVLFEDVLVSAFKSSTNARAQGFLAYVMQELLRFSGFNEVASVRLRASQSSPTYMRWIEMPENVRNILTPFLTSRYVLTSNTTYKTSTYPIFAPTMNHSTWLRSWVFDLLLRAKGENPQAVFPYLARVIRLHDLAIANFLLPYAALNVVLGGVVKEVEDIAQEMLVVLSTESTVEKEKATLRQCSENVFAVLDYMSRWMQEKKKALATHRAAALRAGHSPADFSETNDLAQIDGVEKAISSIPANIIAQRAIECGSYARALFHWEHYIREQSHRPNAGGLHGQDAMYQRLQSIYTQIDEPDGLEGISAKLNFLTGEQQAFQHRRAGRWSAAQSWYEIESAKRPTDHDLKLGLVSCLKESGHYSQVLNLTSEYSRESIASHVDRGFKKQLLSFASEASWMTDRFDYLRHTLAPGHDDTRIGFNAVVGSILLMLQDAKCGDALEKIDSVKSSIVSSLSSSNAGSLQSCHKPRLQLHVLYEMGAVVGDQRRRDREEGEMVGGLTAIMDKRLAVLGSSIPDKQYILGIRRATAEATSDNGAPLLEMGSSWLTTARLARKTNILSTAHYAVLRAAQCGDDAAKIEQARLLWKENQHRQAIRGLENAIASNVFAAYDRRMEENSNPEELQSKQNMLSARANLLLAKWLDASGQSQATLVTSKYQHAAKHYARWEKGHYYLGKHYNKLLEAERALPASKQSEAYSSGETTKLVIENYLRSVPFGTKYWFQTIPKLLTLWLDLGMDCMKRQKDDPHPAMFERRQKHLDMVHRQLKKYFDRVPPYIFYTALPQMISRISHPHPKVYEVLATIISKIVSTHPSQALWSVLAVAKATLPERAKRGTEIINKLKDAKNRTKSDSAGLDLRTMIIQGQKLSDGLLQACEVHIEGRSTNISLSKDLGFSHKLAPSALVVPFESALTANVPTVQDASHIRHFKAFAQDRVTIQSFSDDVLVLSSLQRPRKLTLRGSDGKLYSILCKPKDDLRKDQRLMEFNTMINRALKRDAESSKRRLYIKTYGVTPLSEESGTIEWVEGIKPLRDILLKLYQRKGIQPNYTELRVLLAEASANSANVGVFTDKILPMFPALLHEWFVEVFPEPDTWFAARLRYARSAAVMSMVGHVLGLGDRHGENILLEEGTGGVFHVDFNCLFDKGLTFEKPELVPFRLTHNMVDAMGAYGYEGPFRRSSELTLGLLRQHQDTLMNILETFLHDPTTDFIGKKKRTTPGVPDTPQEVLDSVVGKLRGFLRGESVPLSVEGHVEALITQAVDPWHLCQMYIGWCAFL